MLATAQTCAVLGLDGYIVQADVNAGVIMSHKGGGNGR